MPEASRIAISRQATVFAFHARSCPTAEAVPATVVIASPRTNASLTYHGIRSRCPCPPTWLHSSRMVTTASRNSDMYAMRSKYGDIGTNAISYCTAKMKDLLSFLQIPSISALPEHAADVRRAAEFVRDWLARAGLQNARLIEGDGNPLV